MSGKIENIDGKIVFSYPDGEYQLRSQPYEPCLYICKDGETIKVLHNAFDVYDLPAIFGAGETVRAIDGSDVDEDTFCKVLMAAINDKRYEMDWTFAAGLAENNI